MAMQIATIRKINNFKALIGDKLYTRTDILSMIENRTDMPSWTTLRKYEIVTVKCIETFIMEMADNDNILWNGYYEWNPTTEKWIVDHNFNMYGLT